MRYTGSSPHLPSGSAHRPHCRPGHGYSPRRKYHNFDWRTHDADPYPEGPACDIGDCILPKVRLIWQDYLVQLTYRFTYIDWNHDGAPTHMSSSPHDGLEGRLTREKRLVHTRVCQSTPSCPFVSATNLSFRSLSFLGGPHVCLGYVCMKQNSII